MNGEWGADGLFLTFLGDDCFGLLGVLREEVYSQGCQAADSEDDAVLLDGASAGEMVSSTIYAVL